MGDLIYHWATYFRVERQVKMIIYVPSSRVDLFGLFLFPSSGSNGSLYSLILSFTRRLRFALVAGLAGNIISSLFSDVLFLSRYQKRKFSNIKNGRVVLVKPLATSGVVIRIAHEGISPGDPESDLN